MKSKFRVLSVEDDVRWQTTIKEIVSMLGYEVEFVSTREDAIFKLRRSSYHVALLDKRLKESNPENDEGLDIATMITRLGEGTKVVVYTAYGNMDDAVKAFHDIKVSHFVGKDKPLSQIRDALKQAAEEADREFRRPTRLAQNILSADDTATGEFLSHFMTDSKSRPDLHQLELFAKRLAGEYRPLLPDRNQAKLLSIANNQILQFRFWSKMLGFPIAVCIGTHDGIELTLEKINSDEKLRSSLGFGKKTIKEVFDRDVFPDFGGGVFELRNTKFEEFKS